MYNPTVTYSQPCGRAWDDRGRPLPGCIVPYGLGAAAPVAAVELGQIRTGNGYVYQITAEDILWLARAVQFEGGQNYDATIWTYTQLQAQRRRVGSLTSLIRAHSQPVNPLWATPDAGKWVQVSGRGEPKQIDRRARARTIPWNQIRASVRSKVLAWAKAELPNPVPGAVDFADAEVSSGFLRRHPGSAVVLYAGNWYIARPDTLLWPPNYVTVNYQGRSSTVAGVSAVPIALIGGAVVVTAGVFAYWAWRRSRRR